MLDSCKRGTRSKINLSMVYTFTMISTHALYISLLVNHGAHYLPFTTIIHDAYLFTKMSSNLLWQLLICHGIYLFTMVSTVHCGNFSLTMATSQ